MSRKHPSTGAKRPSKTKPADRPTEPEALLTEAKELVRKIHDGSRQAALLELLAEKEFRFGRRKAALATRRSATLARFHSWNDRETDEPTRTFDELLETFYEAAAHNDIEAGLDAARVYGKAFCDGLKKTETEKCDAIAEHHRLQNEAFLESLTAALIDWDRIPELATILDMYPADIRACEMPALVHLLLDRPQEKTRYLQEALSLARRIPVDSFDAEFRVDALVTIARRLLVHRLQGAALPILDEVLALNETIRPDYRGGAFIAATWTVNALFETGYPDDAERLLEQYRDKIQQDHLRRRTLPSLAARDGRVDEAMERFWNELKEERTDAASLLPELFEIYRWARRLRGDAAARPILDDALLLIRRRLKNKADQVVALAELAGVLMESAIATDVHPDPGEKQVRRSGREAGRESR